MLTDVDREIYMRQHYGDRWYMPPGHGAAMLDQEWAARTEYRRQMWEHDDVILFRYKYHKDMELWYKMLWYDTPCLHHLERE